MAELKADPYGTDDHKAQATAWFTQLRDDLCAALEAAELDVEGPNPSAEGEPGTFERKAWERPAAEGAAAQGGGGVMSILRGRVFDQMVAR